MCQIIRTLSVSTEITWSPKGCKRQISALWPLKVCTTCNVKIQKNFKLFIHHVILFILTKKQKNKKTPHKCPTFDYPRLDQQIARNHTFSPVPPASPVRKHGLGTQKWDLWGSAFQPSWGRRHAKSWVPQPTQPAQLHAF